MSAASAMNVARAVETPGYRGTQLSPYDRVALSPANPKVFSFNVPNSSESSSRYVKPLSGSRVSAPDLVCLFCFRSSTRGAKRSWPFNHENVHSR